MSKFDQTLTTFFQTRPLLNLTHSGPLVVAVSGGRDSLCLLHWLVHSPQITNKLIPVYVDHGLRPEAAAEGESLRQQLAQWGVDCQIKSAGLTADTFTENNGRVARYKIFLDIAQQAGASFVLTGHHAADQAETVLLHLLRGSGLNGLTGMRPESTIPRANAEPAVEPQVKLLRPMLQATPDMLAQYAARYNLRPIEDPSNQELRFLRNRLRHNLIPQLEQEFNPQITKSLGQMATILQDDWDALKQLHLQQWENGQFKSGDGWCALDLPHWQTATASYQRFALRKLYAHLHGSTQDLTLENLEAARYGLLQAKTDSRFQLSGTLWAQVVYRSLVVSSATAGDLFNAPQLPDAETVIDISIDSTRTLKANGWTLTAARISAEDVALNLAESNKWLAFLDTETIHGPLVIRGRKSGEALHPLGLDGQVALKKLMIDRKIPATLRDKWPLIADDTGVLWVAGHRLAQRGAITSTTKHAIQLELTNYE